MLRLQWLLLLLRMRRIRHNISKTHDKDWVRLEMSKFRDNQRKIRIVSVHSLAVDDITHLRGPRSIFVNTRKTWGDTNMRIWSSLQRKGDREDFRRKYNVRGRQWYCINLWLDCAPLNVFILNGFPSVVTQWVGRSQSDPLWRGLIWRDSFQVRRAWYFSRGGG